MKFGTVSVTHDIIARAFSQQTAAFILSPHPPFHPASFLTVHIRKKPVWHWHSCSASSWQPADLKAVWFCMKMFADLIVLRLSWRQSFIVWPRRRQEAAPLSAEQADALFVKLVYFKAGFLLGDLPLTSSSWGDKMDFSVWFSSVFVLSLALPCSHISNVITSLSFCCLLSPLSVCAHSDDSTPQLSSCFHLNRFHLALIKPDLRSDPCLKAMLVNLPCGRVFSVVVIYCSDITERRLRLDYQACVLRCFSGHTVIGLCRHIFSWSLSNECTGLSVCPSPRLCPSFFPLSSLIPPRGYLSFTVSKLGWENVELNVEGFEHIWSSKGKVMTGHIMEVKKIQWRGQGLLQSTVFSCKCMQCSAWLAGWNILQSWKHPNYLWKK